SRIHGRRAGKPARRLIQWRLRRPDLPIRTCLGHGYVCAMVPGSGARLTTRRWRSHMNARLLKARLLVGILIAVGLVTPAAARNYYIVENTKTHKCSVLPKKPKSKTVVLVKGSPPYKTRAEARAAMGTFAPCKT